MLLRVKPTQMPSAANDGLQHFGPQMYIRFLLKNRTAHIWQFLIPEVRHVDPVDGKTEWGVTHGEELYTREVWISLVRTKRHPVSANEIETADLWLGGIPNKDFTHIEGGEKLRIFDKGKEIVLSEPHPDVQREVENMLDGVVTEPAPVEADPDLEPTNLLIESEDETLVVEQIPDAPIPVEPAPEIVPIELNEQVSSLSNLTPQSETVPLVEQPTAITP